MKSKSKVDRIGTKLVFIVYWSIYKVELQNLRSVLHDMVSTVIHSERLKEIKILVEIHIAAEG